MLVIRNTHNFVVKDVPPRYSGYVKGYVRQFHEIGDVNDEVTGRSTVGVIRTYAFWPKEKDQINLHISAYDDFMAGLSNLPGLVDTLTVVDKRYTMAEAAPASFAIKNIHEPRPYQATIIGQIVNSDSNNEIITLPPGAGKTLTAFHILHQIKRRSLFMMRGGYFDRWIPDLDNTFDLSDGKLLVVKGQSDLIRLMELSVEKEVVADLILTSIDTISKYIDIYLNEPHMRLRYAYSPDELFEKLGIGVVGYDEGHQNAHKAMRIFCHTNVPLTLTLSATLTTKDAFKNRIYKIMYPEANRRDAGYRDVYIGVNAMMYRLENIRRIRHSGYKGAYSHTNFEQSMLMGKNRKTLAGYLDLVKYSIDLRYLKDYLPKSKCIVFFATVNMCDVAVKYLKSKYPHLNIARYVAKDPMSVMDDADIIVSTVLSAGTAVDIADLRISIMTTAIDSEISNQQARGRTRRMKRYPHITPEFCYFVCKDIPKHMQYHANKRGIFSGWVVYHNEITLPNIA